ncbi:tRNA (cytosine(32)/uridine(32)-2'-O)-methyltransferase TrmJ [Neptunomonas japonica]|uniref:tRNA (cytidine/uridine-2'-O-)-methyltransferase TrmJ n=1 Tax=Neptunomonas japonica JAMM 1380 TaxID=1441457 RepID=A0A7R6PGX3_9GAMM|nr:tRNA (cytosine(32)/uridine(32)-2'-O)-methyltransferase TrmJ [Neptunomonas japonica]BBB29992.1 tRNA (cytidine32/uridine32-2'-O)-methyltransferase [Neptunomonas japonica JAMM 1380]
MTPNTQLNNVRIVLINTFHPGNIGAAARAMKNMGLSQLWLVDPREYPSEEADSRAAGAKDVLDNATVVGTLKEAIADCQLVIGTSARNRTFDLPILDARNCAEKITSEAVQGEVALVFGRETMGLLNEELQLCNFHVYIPANPEYPVLNVAQAIQLLSYEIWMAAQTPIKERSESEYPRQNEMELFYTHLETVIRATNFIIPQHEGRAMTKLKRYFNRTRPEKAELGMLRGILASVQETIENLSSTEKKD